MVTFLFVLFIVLLFLSAIGAFIGKIVKQSINRKGELGINFRDLICPYCNKKTVLQRPPTLEKQVPWGAGVCSNCGCEMNKWGNEISTLADDKKIAKQLEHMKISPIPPFDESGKTRLEKVFEDNNK